MTYKLIADEFEINVYYLNLTESQVKLFNFLNDTRKVFWRNDTYKLESCTDEKQEYEDLIFDYNYNCSKVVITDIYWNPIFLVLDDFQLSFYNWLVANRLISDDVKIAMIRKKINFTDLT